MKDFAGKILFITGGASGAGLGQAKVFSEAGCKVVIADIRKDHLDQAMDYFRDKKAEVYPIQLDVTDRKAFAAAADEVEKVFGSPPQLLFLTAGVNAFGPAEASTFEDYDWVMGVCLGGVVNGLVTFVPRMIQAGKGGYIVATASMGGLMPASGCTPYSAAKAAVIALMECYYNALKPYGIGVSCLCPGGIKSNIGESHLTRPKHLANTGYHLDEKVVEFMRKHYSYGIDPVDLAKILKKGIEDEVLFIIPVPDPEGFMRNVLERMVNYTTPEGMKRQEELMKKRMEEMRKTPNPMFEGAAEAGWGKPRKDLTWVKPHGPF
ncbi:MAG: SDR family NAD(P)-dependent oxidoreductase [Dehalococcoidales bacterium]|jgi:NAD(P)-dependent dehydrogenase (short-subunit alcohol dehydrogenase family)|nr:SDR family NAD(P)-dependent oxidoreductase [Dehalococcoidales bacterium]